MYTPPAFEVDSRQEILEILRQVSFGHLVRCAQSSGSGPHLRATPVPIVVDDDISSIRAHFARANRQWREIGGTSALLIVAGVDAYVSPRWYPSKEKHSKVVPTWNYEVVHLHGMIEIHDDPEWKRDVVEDLTAHNEARIDDPDRASAWKVSDAPATFVEAQLDAIVGVELHIEFVEGTRKLSQNRPMSDRAGVAKGLACSERLRDRGTAELMASVDR